MGATDWSVLFEVARQDNSSKAGYEVGSLDIDFPGLITILVWVFNGFHKLSVFACEVRNPVTAYRTIMLISFVLLPLMYILPFATALAVNNPSWTTWTSGSMGKVARQIGGEPLYLVTLGSALVSSTGLYVSCLLSSSYLACGMAEQKFVPTSLGMYVAFAACLMTALISLKLTLWFLWGL